MTMEKTAPYIVPSPGKTRPNNKKGQIDMKAYKHFALFAIKAGHRLTVSDCEGIIARNLTSSRAVVEAVEAVEECTVSAYDIDGNRIGTAYVSLDNEPTETVYDYSDNGFMNQWASAYFGFDVEDI